MSRIGNKLIPLVEGVTLTIENNYVDVKGKNGEDKISYDPKLLKIEVVDNHVKITRANDLKATKHKITLIVDQSIHITQVVVTWVLLVAIK